MAAIPGTGVVFTAEALFRPGYAVGSALPTIYLAVAVLMLAIGSLVITVLAGRRNLPKTDDVTGGETGAGRTARFLDRLPPELGRDLVCLRMADHYVEVFHDLRLNTDPDAFLPMRSSNLKAPAGCACTAPIGWPAIM